VKAVIGTNVVAYLVLGTEKYVGEARTFLDSVDEALAPALWEAELTNVLWMATRHKVLTIEDAISRLPNRMLWQGALMRAYRSGVAAYDTLFVELAARERMPLATFDTALLKAFPTIAARPAALMT
jgi:predicted nucleic acid-binding protein